MTTVDLHVHTTWSDGRLSPREVIQEAAKLGLSAVAVADHDVVGGLDEAAEAAADVGIELVPAVELTAGWRGRTVHVLGYFIDPRHAELAMALERSEAASRRHVDAVLAELARQGEPLSAVALDQYRTRYPCGASLVFAMVERGMLRRLPEPWRALRMAAAEPRVFSAEQTIELIHQAGGAAVLAHPGKISRREPYVSAEALQPLLEAGLDGLEAWNVAHSLGLRDYYRHLADRLGIIATGGSDCHGRRNQALRLGSQEVPSEALDALREFRRLSSMRR